MASQPTTLEVIPHPPGSFRTPHVTGSKQSGGRVIIDADTYSVSTETVIAPFPALEHIMTQAEDGTSLHGNHKNFWRGAGFACLSALLTGFALIAENRAASIIAAFSLCLALAFGLRWLEDYQDERGGRPS